MKVNDDNKILESRGGGEFFHNKNVNLRWCRISNLQLLG